MIEGFWQVQWGNVFHYIRELKNPTIVAKYARDIKKDVWDRVFFNHGFVGLGLGIVSAVSRARTRLGSVCGRAPRVPVCLRALLVHQRSLPSRRVQELRNTATNLRFIAWLTGGEGLHNNHHGFPRSPKFSFRPSEVDPAWPVIKLLTALKLAKPYKTIAEAQLTSKTA